MTERDTLQRLIEEGAVATTLRKGSGARHAIAALQTLLHWLGFDRKLKWDKYGAEGGVAIDYPTEPFDARTSRKG